MTLANLISGTSYFEGFYFDLDGSDQLNDLAQEID